jgi:hypothetical protein
LYKRFLAVQHLIVCLFYRAIFVSWNYFLNIFRPNTPSPTKPEPISKIVAGSGIGEAPPPSVPPGAVIGVEVVEVKLDVVGGLSDEGQPTIPKNIITTHKNINNFFILPPP